jgi:hypothetical protein
LPKPSPPQFFFFQRIIQLVKKYLIPRNIFILLLLIFFVILLAIDLGHPGTNNTKYLVKESFLGSLFLAQCAAILLTTAIVFLVPQYHKRQHKWIIASCISLTLIAFSFLFFYHGPRVITEADGQDRIGYYCTYGELYSTVEGNEPLCVLKNMPLAISNVAMVQKGSAWLPPYEQIVSFVLLEAILAGSLLIPVKIKKRKT